MLLGWTFKIYDRTLANKTIKEIKGKLAEELYTFKVSRTTRNLIFGIRINSEKLGICEKVSDGIHRLYESICWCEKRKNLEKLEKIGTVQLFREK
jgi:hypothetical protein